MGFLHLLTNSQVMDGSPRTIVEAWHLYRALRQNARVVFAPDQEQVDSRWHQLMTQPGIGPSFWTDAYLAAFALTYDYPLVTFDTGFQRWADLPVRVLTRA